MLEDIFLAEPIERSEAVETNVNSARISNDELWISDDDVNMQMI